MTTEINAVDNTPNKNSILSEITKPDFKNSLQQYLPRGFSAERMAKIILSDVRKNPKLMTCEKMSFLAAVSQVAQLGLEPGVMGHCYLLPYDNKGKGITECQLIIGYKGLIDLVYRSGKVSTVQANVVDQADDFHFNYGAKPDIHHVPAKEQSGHIIYVYAVVTFKDGSFQFIVMTMDEIAKIKACSRGARNYKGENIATHPWNAWPEEMMKKSALKRLFKYVPISIEVATALNVDEVESVGGLFGDMTDVTNTNSEQLIEKQASGTESLLNELQEAA
jgi:recombination protein RecT